jgi:transcriptional regulator with XRE-family HTH domain
MAVSVTINGPVLRALRTERLWSQAELASRSCAFAQAEGDRQCGITRETISKLERGHRAPSPRTLRYLIGALQPTVADLRRLLGREPPRALTHVAGRERTPDAAARRDLLSSGLAAMATLPLDRRVRVNDLLLLLTPSHRPGACTIGLAPVVLAGAAARHLRTIAQLHGYATTYGRRQWLHVVGADPAALVGWLSRSLDRRAEVEDAITLAWRLARVTDDRVLQDRVHSLLGWLASATHTGCSGRLGDATAVPRVEHAAGGVEAACWHAVATARHTAQRRRGRHRRRP